jgi:ATP-dependent Clp protease ATP-binding subunit ClpC
VNVFLEWGFFVLAVAGAVSLATIAWDRVRSSRATSSAEEPREPSDKEDREVSAVPAPIAAAVDTEAAGSIAFLVAAEAGKELDAQARDPWNTNLETVESLPVFTDAVRALSGTDVAIEEVVSLSRYDEPWIATIATAALVEREDTPQEWVAWAARASTRNAFTEDRLKLRAIARHASEPFIGRVLPALRSYDDDLIVEFIRERIAAGETVEMATFDMLPPDSVDMIQAFVERHEAVLDSDFTDVFTAWRTAQALRGVGRISEGPFDQAPALIVGTRQSVIDLVRTALDQRPRRSVLLVGENGVGKTTLARAALDGLEDDVLLFEAGAAHVNAGATFIGELEGRVKALVEAMAGEAIVWLFPEFQEALFAGQHQRSPQGLLDALMPHVDSGAVTILGELTPSAAEVITSQRPRVSSAFDIVRVRPLDEADAIEVAKDAIGRDVLDVTTNEETLSEAAELARQFLPGIASPGNLLRVTAAAATEAFDNGRQEFDKTDVLATLASTSGIPLSLLDPTSPLSLEDVRAFFNERVLEQPEAVDCLVERISMIKAGVTDPTRPLGVFLFVGPTGTGKTEIAKTLAEYLFGSPERLIRLDMSEFQTGGSLERLLADTTMDSHGAALISSVRKEPFSVVLLDEFEKAAQPIWDLFLQVFDDGRLTDLQGRVVDFRRCVIILTSNLGSPIAEGPAIGFEPPDRKFRTAALERAITMAFRPEFRNRIDRTVVFRPFERSAMRALLDKELVGALARRGLRSRPWQVEMDESAYAFLTDKGFTPDLGARPLKRALEQHLLAPIAASIVEQSVPEGDQFLYVSADDDRIYVTFVDPGRSAEEVAEGELHVEPAPTRDRRRASRQIEHALRDT